MSSSNQEKVARTGIKREAGYLYFFKAWRQKLPKDPASPPEMLADAGVKTEEGYIYSIDAEGDIVRIMTAAKRAEVPLTGSPVTFAQAFAPLAAHIGAPVFLQHENATAHLAAGSHALTVFDWPALADASRAALADRHLGELVLALGDGWHTKQVPLALIGGEPHPIPFDDLDQHLDGVLLLDLATGCVVHCPSPSHRTGKLFAPSTAVLSISTTSPPADEDEDDDDD